MSLYLVTGGAGFIGSNLAHALAARGERVRVLDNFSTGREQNLAGLAGKIDVRRGDITDRQAVREAMAGVDFVLHHAALPSVQQSVEDPITADRVNVLGTLHVLEAARDEKVKRLVYAGSCAAYGESPELPKLETMLPAPMSPYAVSKLAGEHYCQVFRECYGLQTVVLRYFNIFGPRQDPRSHYAAVIPNFVTAALAGRQPTIFGDGGQTRDFCFVDNCVEANLLACTAPEAPGGPYNIACGDQTSLLDVVAALSEIVGRRLAPTHLDGRAGDIRHSVADVALARARLGYTCPVRFAEGLQKTVAWYRGQP